MNVFTKTLLLLLAMIPTATAYTENFESFDEGAVIKEIPPSNYGLSIDVVRRGCSEKALIMDTSSPTGTSLHQPQHGKVLVLSPDGESPNPCEDGGVLKFKFSPGSYVSSIGLLVMDERVRILVFPDTPGNDSWAIDLPANGGEGYISVPINDVVKKINVKFKGTGAVTEIEFGCGGVLMDAGNGIDGCWYTAPDVGMSCHDVCAAHGGFDATASQHVGNAVGSLYWPDKEDGMDWASVECSSTDNDTNWGANGTIPDDTFSHSACYVNCACKK